MNKKAPELGSFFRCYLGAPDGTQIKLRIGGVAESPSVSEKQAVSAQTDCCVSGNEMATQRPAYREGRCTADDGLQDWNRHEGISRAVRHQREEREEAATRA